MMADGAPKAEPDEKAIREKVESLLRTECPFGFEVFVTLTKRLRAVQYLGVTVRIDGRLSSEVFVQELLAKIVSVAGICEWRGDVVSLYEVGKDQSP